LSLLSARLRSATLAYVEKVRWECHSLRQRHFGAEFSAGLRWLKSPVIADICSGRSEPRWASPKPPGVLSTQFSLDL